jgi:hypothetical protein
MPNLLTQSLFQLALWAPPMAVLVGIVLVILPGKPRRKGSAPPVVVNHISRPAA